MWTYIENLLNNDKFVDTEIHNLKEAIKSAPPLATRSHTYIALNPSMEVHPIYTDSSTTIPDYLRISFTRFRLSSHLLRIETGRWSRTPRDERLCQCGTGIQNELHVFTCPLVMNISRSFSKPCITPNEFFEATTISDLKTLHQIMDILGNSHSDSSSS